MPKDNPEAYNKIDKFIAGLNPDERRYLYGAIEAIVEASDNGETMEEPGEMSTDMPEADMMAESPGPVVPEDDDTTDYDELFKA
jgi:hypothetical protein